MVALHKAFRVVGIVLLIELALQFYLIAAAALSVWSASDNAQDVYAAFKNGDSFASLHGLVGTFVIPLTVIILIALAFAAHLPARAKGQTGGLLAMVVVQFILGAIGTHGGAAIFAIVGGLHGLNALAIVGLAGSLLFSNWSIESRAPVSPATSQ